MLPLQIVDWRIFQNEKEVSIFWESENEELVESYILERSLDGVSFQKIKEVQVQWSAAGARNYYTVENIHINEGVNFFRIKQVNKDGSYDLTSIKVHQFVHSFDLPKAYPNPFSNVAKLESVLFVDQKVSLKLFNLQTQFVAHQIINSEDRIISLSEMINGIREGIYILEIEIDKQFYQLKLLKRKE